MKNSIPLSVLTNSEKLQIDKMRLAVLLQQGLIAILTNIVITSITAYALYTSETRMFLSIWAGISIFICMLRVGLVIQLKSLSSNKAVTQQQVLFYENSYAMSVLLSGFMWSLLGLSFSLELSFNHQMIIPLVACGMCSGAVYSMLISFRSYCAFAIPALLPMGIMMIMHGFALEAATVFVYLLSSTLLVKNLNVKVMESLGLQRENEQLVVDLMKTNDHQSSLLKKLERKEAFLTQTFEEAGIPMFLTTPELIVVDANKAACKIFAYSKVDFIGSSLCQFFHQEESRDISPEYYKLLDGKISQYSMIKKCMTANHEKLWLNGTVSVVKDESGRVQQVLVQAQDITQQQELSEDLNHQLTHDRLTGLPNRYALEKRLQLLLKQPRPFHHVFCYIDLDQFKVINDTCGHYAGDSMLLKVTDLLAAEIKPRDIISRVSGDEFAIIYHDVSFDDALNAMNILMDKIRTFTFLHEDVTYNITASVGMVDISNEQSMVDVLRKADSACFAAKEMGRDRIHCFSDDDVELVQRRGEMQWVSRIQHALANERLVLFSQPIVATQEKNNTVPHCELLIRMLDDNGEIIPPGAFLPAAERYNLAASIDIWTVTHVLQRLEAAHKADEDIRGVYGINLSGQSLGDRRFYEKIIELINQTDIFNNGAIICFEITETAAITNLHSALHFINELRTFGCLFALDDFGSGLSSFAYLKQMPIDFLKIDGQFVKDCVTNSVNLEIVNSINGIGQVLGLKTVAEFVEDKKILVSLQHIGVDFVQGYELGRPELWQY